VALSLLCTLQVFSSHAQFKDWFSNPLTGMVEGAEVVDKVRGFALSHSLSHTCAQRGQCSRSSLAMSSSVHQLPLTRPCPQAGVVANGVLRCSGLGRRSVCLASGATAMRQ
jgi:hypothetical protein